MSLLDRGAEPIIVYPEKLGIDSQGNRERVPDMDNGVEVMALVQPGSVTESTGRGLFDKDATELGQNPKTVYRVICRDAPLGAWSRVWWRGRYWDGRGEPKMYTSGSRTKHFTAWITARTPEPME